MADRASAIAAIFLVGLVLTIEGSNLGRSLKTGDACSTPGFFADFEDCRNFYRCAEHPTSDDSPPQLIKFIFRCPSGTVFDESLSTCNHPDAVPDKQGVCQIYDPEDGIAAPEPAGGYRGLLNQLQFHQPVVVPPVNHFLIPGVVNPYRNVIWYG